MAARNAGFARRRRVLQTVHRAVEALKRGFYGFHGPKPLTRELLTKTQTIANARDGGCPPLGRLELVRPTGDVNTQSSGWDETERRALGPPPRLELWAAAP